MDWAKVLEARAGPRLVALPTYAFQRQRYWLEAQRASGDVSTMGLWSAEHPLLGAATPLADGERFLLTGRLSATEPGWLGDYAVFGTVLAWVLVRDDFRGKRLINALIDLPFALPTIVAGVVLLALYGKGSPIGIDIAFTRASVALALLFVTLPFVVRSVQPVLHELDVSMEEAAESLGATQVGASA